LGDHRQTRSIYTDIAELEATVNLFSALRDSRDENRIMPMWADGISINQNDDVEKSKQVAMMGEIYAAAYKTIICLGPSENGFYKSPCLPIIASQVDDMQESGNEAGDSQESEHESQSDLLAEEGE
jgi:hypothetical protein